MLPVDTSSLYVLTLNRTLTMTTLKIFAVLLIAVITLFETSVAQFGIPPIGAGMGGYGPVGGYGAQGGYGMGRGNYGGRGEYGIPGRGYGQGGYGYL
ncbi:neuropeptide-like protein 31 [Nasonia vitripennis]|uniref:Uncharacterized protein n=1 Tax=Nasonia vitripennis TaxID=7425 RepID=A0A7M7GHW8_NASVI|nr:neuropeptide-like protein 31 [Nasonia vitripennis]